MVAAIKPDNRLQVLIGDDDRSSAEAIARVFPAEQFNIYVAGDVDAVVHIVRQVPIDLYFIDQKLPTLGGIATLKLIKQFGRPVRCVLTGQETSKEDLLKAAEADAYTHIRKPLDNRELLFVLQRFLQRFYGLQMAGVALEAVLRMLELLDEGPRPSS